MLFAMEAASNRRGKEHDPDRQFGPSYPSASMGTHLMDHRMVVAATLAQSARLSSKSRQTKGYRNPDIGYDARENGGAGVSRSAIQRSGIFLYCRPAVRPTFHHDKSAVYKSRGSVEQHLNEMYEIYPEKVERGVPRLCFVLAHRADALCPE